MVRLSHSSYEPEEQKKRHYLNFKMKPDSNIVKRQPFDYHVRPEGEKYILNYKDKIFGKPTEKDEGIFNII